MAKRVQLLQAPRRPTSPSWRGEQASSFGLSLAICLSLTHTEEMGGVTLVTLGRTHAWLCVCAGQRWACEWAEVRSGRGATWTLSAQGPPQRRWDSESTLLPIGSKCDLLTKFTGKVGSETSQVGRSQLCHLLAVGPSPPDGAVSCKMATARNPAPLDGCEG